MRPVLSALVSIASCVMSATGAQAEEVDTSAWSCALCAASHGTEVDIEVGPGFVSDDEYRFGDYTGLDDDGLYVFGDVFARHWSDNAHFLRFDGHRVGQDSRALFFQGGKQGLYKVRASYQGIPRRIYDDTVSPYRRSSSDRLNLPAGWVRGSSTQDMTALNGSLKTVKIKEDWDIYGAGVRFTPTSRWAFDVDYRRTERSGRDAYAGSFFFDAAEFTRPIDYVTDDVESSVAYNADRWNLSLAYYGSFFSNDNSTLSWDNPYTSTLGPGADTGKLALPPDNESHQVTLAGSLLLPAKTTMNGQLSIGRMEQDENLTGYTTNSLIATSPLPRKSVDGEINTTNAALRVTSSPLSKFTVEGEVRYNERDNDTPEKVYDYVVTDLFTSPDAARNIAYSYQRYDYKLRGEYELLRRTRLHAGYDYQRYERTRQVRDETETDTLWMKLNSRAMQFADVDIKLYVEERDGSSYESKLNAADPQNPRMRLYNLANRDRHGVRAYTSFYAGDRLSIGVDVEYNKDKYDDSDIGLQDSTEKRFGIDASYLFPRDVSAYASAYFEQIKTEQDNSQSFSNPDWLGKTEDRFYTGTVGLRYPRIIGLLGANVEYNYARSRGQTENDTRGLESEFPKLRSTLHQVKLAFEYPYKKSTDLKVGYLYEKYDSDDWGLEDIGPDTVPNLLSLGAKPYDYSNHVFFVGVRYRFDSRRTAAP
ncbi:MtrB/PioB family decaheme-associated outer membrane protein [Thiogranum longum]